MMEFRKAEEEVLNFWEKNKIYEKVKEKNKNGKKFYFLQGPPYTSGKLHIGQAWNNSLKDVAIRYRRMQGYDVWDRGGYDMHGLPTENAVQKKLGIKTKEEIEKFGIANFIKECINFSEEYSGYMDKDLWRMGVWMDHKNAYKPIKKEFVSGEWAFFKKAWEQKRLYRGLKVMHWDAENGTSLAKHELEYKTVKDISIFLKFKKKKTSNEYFIIWTTTPWTIPYNLAIMANPEVDYVKAKVEEEYWIMAKPLVYIFIQGLLGKKFEIVEEMKGSELDGQEYEHFLKEDMPGVYEKIKKEWPRVHTIILSKEYVNTDSGSGLVHCAPGCGPEDFEVGKKYGIGPFNTLNEKGELQEVGKFNGWFAKIDDEKFIEEFKNKGVLLATNEIEHEYPFGARSHKPVVFRTTKQWFLKTEDLIQDLLDYNKKVYWNPKKFGESYEKWVENLRDNGVTRQRYWGCPVPIWINENDEDDVIVVGSVEELEKLSGKKLDDLTVHRPWIDEIIIEKNGKKYVRIKDVVDVWIDAGTTSWNSLNNNEELIKKYFPADLVLEATEQTRLWFSMLQICSAIMFNSTSYKNVYVHGMIYDYQGMKMSKSLGNIISPYEVIDKYSVDILRNYLCGVTAGEAINFSWDDIKVKQRNLIIFKNILNYILDLEKQKPAKGKIDIEERWIISKYNSTLKKVTELFEEYRLDETVKEIEDLYITLSRDYIKIVRDKAGENSAVLNTVKEVYIGILKMFSTICPFITEKIWQELRAKKIVEEESVHLCSWPKFEEDKIDKKLEKNFAEALKIIEIGLAERDKIKIGLRWPLPSAEIIVNEKKKNEYDLEKMEEIILRQLNLKKIEFKFGKTDGYSITLDTHLTPELEEEGYAREIARKIQAERKKKGLEKKDLIELDFYLSEEMKKILKNQEKFLKERVNAKKINFVSEGPIHGAVFEVKEEKIGAVIKKIDDKKERKDLNSRKNLKLRG